MLYSRLDLPELTRLFREGGRSPSDVLNFLTFDDLNSYKIYGALVVPTIFMVGGSIRWSGKHSETVYGKAVCDSWLIVRYPNIRAFLLMIANPVYSLFNVFRERGVAKFEASYTDPVVPGENLGEYDDLFVVHFNGGRTEIEQLVETFGKPVYGSRAYQDFSFIKDKVASDPNPLTYRNSYAWPGMDASEAQTKVSRLLADSNIELSAHIYHKSGVTDYIPFVSR